MANYAGLHNSSHHTRPHPIIANDYFHAKLLGPIVTLYKNCYSLWPDNSKMEIKMHHLGLTPGWFVLDSWLVIDSCMLLA